MAKSKVSKKMQNVQRRNMARRERLAWIEKQRAK